MTPAEAPFRVLPFDQGAERSAGTLRLVAAAVVGLAAIWLALLSPSVVGWVCAATGALGSLAWIGMWARGRRKIVGAPSCFLALEPDALRIVDGTSERSVPWETVREVEVDEDRLVVRVALGSGGEVILEPTFGGLGAYDLAAALRAAREATD